MRGRFSVPATDVIGLLPIMWSAGAGADVMKRIAAPLMGGVVTSGVVVLVMFPVAFHVWKGRRLGDGDAIAVDVEATVT